MGLQQIRFVHRREYACTAQMASYKPAQSPGWKCGQGIADLPSIGLDWIQITSLKYNIRDRCQEY